MNSILCGTEKAAEVKAISFEVSDIPAEQEANLFVFVALFFGGLD
jgi:hypothetical protein